MLASFAQAGQHVARLIAYLGLQAADLRLQGLHARMAGQQRRRKIGLTRHQIGALFGQPGDDGRGDNVGKRVDRRAAVQRAFDAADARFQRGAFGAHARQFRRQFGELLGRKYRIVLAHEKAVGGAVLGNGRFCGAHLVLERTDLAFQIVRGRAGVLQLGAAFKRHIGPGQRIGDARGKLGIGRAEADDDHPRVFDRKDSQTLAHRIKDALFPGNVGRVGAKPQGRQSASERRHGRGVVEFAAGSQIEFPGHLHQKIGRCNDFDLAGHRFLVEAGLIGERVAFGPGEDGFAGIDEHTRVGPVLRGGKHQGNRDQRGDDQRTNQDDPLVAPDGRREPADIDIGVARLIGRNGHLITPDTQYWPSVLKVYGNHRVNRPLRVRSSRLTIGKPPAPPLGARNGRARRFTGH